MTKLWVAVISGATGIAVGLYIAKLYAQKTVSDDIHSALSAAHLGGGVVEQVAQNVIVPLIG